MRRWKKDKALFVTTSSCVVKYAAVAAICHNSAISSCPRLCAPCLRPLLLSTDRQVGHRSSQRPRRMKKQRSLLMEMEKRQITLDACLFSPASQCYLTANEMIDLAILFHGHCQFLGSVRNHCLLFHLLISFQPCIRSRSFLIDPSRPPVRG